MKKKYKYAAILQDRTELNRVDILGIFDTFREAAGEAYVELNNIVGFWAPPSPELDFYIGQFQCVLDEDGIAENGKWIVEILDKNSDKKDDFYVMIRRFEASKDRSTNGVDEEEDD